MKALLQKELRENLWLAGLGLLVFTAMLGSEYIVFREVMSRVVRGEVDHLYYNQPLQGAAAAYSVFFCAIFGAILGWFQVFREQQRNVWAFLLHRPMTPTRIFLGKVLAGLTLYLLVAGLPVLVFILWAAEPRNVPAPFDWWMAVPLIGAVLNGVSFYFAGLLTGVRRAKWYASRVLPFGLPFLVSCCAVSAPQFWQVASLWLASLAVVAVAAWSSFCNSGYDKGQHPTGKPATAVALACGWTIALFFGVIGLADVIERLQPREPWTYHTIVNDGSIYKIVYEQSAPARVLDLQGNPARDPGTGQPLRPADLDELRARTVGMMGSMESLGLRKRHWVEQSWLRFSYWGAADGTLWYLLHPERRLAGFDVASRQFIGSIGPSGFAPNRMDGDDRFSFRNQQTLGTDTALYAIDLSKPAAVKIFSTPADDPIVSVGEVTGLTHKWQYTLVATRNALTLVTPEGDARWRAAYPPGVAGPWSRAYALEPAGSFLLWRDPPGHSGLRSAPSQPSTVAWVSNGQIVRTASVQVEGTKHRFQIQEKLLATTMPPVTVALAPTYLPQSRTPQWSLLLMLSFIAALVCVPIGWVVARRRRLSIQACLAWSVGILVFGIPGLLTLLSLEEPRVSEESAPTREYVSIFEDETEAASPAGH